MIVLELHWVPEFLLDLELLYTLKLDLAMTFELVRLWVLVSALMLVLA